MNNGLQDIRILKIEEILTVSSEKGRFFEMKNRKFYGLSFCSEGQITYKHNGNTYTSTPSNAIIIPQGQSYSLYGNKRGSFPLINFTCTEFFTDTFISIPLQNPNPFIKDFEQMKKLHLFKHNELKVISIFYDILNRLSINNTEKNFALNKAIKYLENNLSDPTLSNKILAEQLGFSEVYFRKLFTSQYGISPKQYIVDARIQKAKQLLSDDLISVSAIAENCGFSSVYHFSRMFKEKVGITPSNYANQNKIITI